MNIQSCDLLLTLAEKSYTNQRKLACDCECSVGNINKSVRELVSAGFLNEHLGLSPMARQFLEERKPRNAIILAAGFGMRMVPINIETPKALLEVRGETLIERLIRQLQEAGIHEIYVVVGFMKEQFEYLIDACGVKLVVNSEYASRNNLYSLKQVIAHVSDSYIIPCDLWCRRNPFSRHELYSWYMVSDKKDKDSKVRVNKKRALVHMKETGMGNQMLGICYLAEPEAAIVRERINQMSKEPKYYDAFWEEALSGKKQMMVLAKVVPAEEIVEINTYEQLRDLDKSSSQLRTDTISVISSVMSVDAKEITDIEVLKKGMTNRSFLFTCKKEKYIMRIPGEGTDRLINRRQEAAVYFQLEGRSICDDIFYISPEKGYKISRYFEGVRACNPGDEEDLRKCMKKLREFHGLQLQVEHTFDIFGQIDFYESLWNGSPSVYRDYQRTKEQVFSLKDFIEQHKLPYVLTHIDAVPDNFLFVKDEFGCEDVRLIDWEYAGMQDPHVDIAMFCLYSLYDKQQVDQLINLYFENKCTWENRTKIYCYIASCGLLWSNWCEYKRQLGVEFGEYSLRQYRYAKEYYRIVRSEMEEKERSGRCTK